MIIEVLFLDNYGDINSEIPPVQLKSNSDNSYILVKGNFITIDDIDYCIHKIRGIYEEGELSKIEVKVHNTYVGEF